MAPSMTWFRLCLVIFILLSKDFLPSSALRPGGDDPIALTSAGSIVLDNGSVIEEYEASAFYSPGWTQSSHSYPKGERV